MTTTTYPTWRGDALAELADANMSGRVDGTLRRRLPAGVDLLCTTDWLDAYSAGMHASDMTPLACVNSAHAHYLAHSTDCLAAPATTRCSICGDLAFSTPCGPCRREAAGL
jgi:hypothetical protein